MASRTLPFLSLSPDAHLMILEKMENREIVQMAQACLYTKDFVENHKKPLSARPNYGQKFCVRVEKKEVCIIPASENEDKRLIVKRGAIQKLAGISLSELFIILTDDTQLSTVKNFLKKWKPVANRVYIGNLSTKHLCEMADYVICNTLTVDFSDTDYERAAKNLGQARNAAVMRLNSYSKDSEFKIKFETIKSFREFCIHTENIEGVVRFIWEMHRATDVKNLKAAEIFIYPDAGYSRFDDLLSITLLPTATILFERDGLIEDRFPLSLRKLSLANNCCAILRENVHFLYGGITGVAITVLTNDDRVILDYILGALEKEGYPEESRQRYFAMNDEERATEMKRMFYEPAPKKAQSRKRRRRN